MNSDTVFLVIISAVGSIVSIAVMFSGTVWFIGKAGGWDSLARRFPLPDGKLEYSRLFTMQSVSVSFLGQYSNIITIGISRSGFIMRPMKLFSCGHKPVYIPFADITGMEERFLFRKKVILECHDRRITIYDPAATVLKSSVEQSLHV